MKKDPKYLEVYKEIKDKIEKEVYKIGDKLPTGEQLAKQYGTSKLTVKKGIDLLVNEGVLHSRSGFGTEVIRKPIHNSKVFGPSQGLMSVVGEEHVHSTIHSFSIELPSPQVMEKLMIKEKEYVYNIIRSRSIDGTPYSIEQTFMPLAVIPGLEPKHLEGSVYQYIKNDLGLQIKNSHIWIKGDLASEQDQQLLSVEPSQFMMEVEKVVAIASGTPFEYSITRHVYEDFVFEAVFAENQ